MTYLSGRTALVTGAGRGIGRAVAVRLAAIGAKVGVLARTKEEVAATCRMIESAGAEAVELVADLRDGAQLHAAMNELGTIDVLVNNAAVAWPVGRIEELEPGRWLDAVSINLGGAFRCISSCLPAMLAQEWGRIVNVTSGAALPPGLLRASAYSASKAALNQLTLNLAAELAEEGATGVTVCAVDPGTVDTDMQRYMRELPEDILGPSGTREFRDVFENGRLQVPTAPASLVAGAIVAAVTGEILVMGTARGAAIAEGDHSR